MLKLGDLIDSSAKVRTKYGVQEYSMSAALAKEFGSVYYSDKVAYYNERYKVLELRMVIGSNSEEDSGIHVIRMAFFGVEGKVYESENELRAALGKTNRYEVVKRKDDIGHEISGEQKIAREIGGLIVPCTSAPREDKVFADYYLPNGKIFYSETGITVNNLCAVSCSCSNYRYMFAEYNERVGAHLGKKLIKYRNPARTGDNPSEAKLNVGKEPGLCKHLMLFTALLISGALLSGYGDVKHLRKEVRSLFSSGSPKGKAQAKLLKDDPAIKNAKASINKTFEDIQRRENIIRTYKGTNPESRQEIKEQMKDPSTSYMTRARKAAAAYEGLVWNAESKDAMNLAKGEFNLRNFKRRLYKNPGGN